MTLHTAAAGVFNPPVLKANGMTNGKADSFRMAGLAQAELNFQPEPGPAQPGGGLRGCESPECSTIIFGAGFCVDCERTLAKLATTRNVPSAEFPQTSGR